MKTSTFSILTHLVKKSVLLIIALAIQSVYAQSPEKISYQAVIRNSNGNLIVNSNVGIKISILQSSATGNAVYVETHGTTTNANGLASIEIGDGTVIAGTFSDIDWASGPYFLQTETDPDGGTNYTITGTSQLLSVPYALYAKTAENVFSGDYNDLSNKPDLNKWDTDSTNDVTIAGNQTITGKKKFSDTVNVDHHPIVNVATPTNDNDATNKAYVDMLLLRIEALEKSVWHEGLVLWNKLGSNDEVTDSEIGENGSLIGTGYAFETGKYGNGYIRKNVDSYVMFPKSVLQGLRSHGTVELWVNPKVTQPQAYSYGSFMIVGYRINELDAHVFIRWGDGVTGVGINGGVNFDGTVVATPDEFTPFVATVDTPFHLALCWDVEGIDGSDQTVRIYRDGVLIGSNSSTWNEEATTDYDDFKLGTGPDGKGYDKYIVDNLKVWNYAKTDFSDRFHE